MMLHVTLSIGALFIIFLFYMLYRVRQAHTCFMQMIEDINNAAINDIQAGRSWEWRYEIMAEVSFDTMLKKIWLKVTPEAFYKDTSFLKEEGRP